MAEKDKTTKIGWKSNIQALKYIPRFFTLIWQNQQMVISMEYHCPFDQIGVTDTFTLGGKADH